MNRVLIMLLTLVTMAPASMVAGSTPSPPEQPATGPGGVETPFDAVHSERFGAAPTGYVLFWPEIDVPAEPLPVVIFLHGFSAVNPMSYRSWIDHIVLRGAILIYPDYQTANPIETPPEDFLANAVAGIRHAMAGLERGQQIPADPHRLAIVGHSLGGVLTANLAAVAEREGLPAPDAIMVVEPGGCLDCGGLSTLLSVPYADLAQIEPKTLALVVAGDKDDIVGEIGARLAWRRMTSIPLEQRDYILVQSDRTGLPPLIADHAAPQTASGNAETDALDWYGYWKWFDLLTDCGFFDLACGDALGGSAAQAYMGVWSDGTAVVEPIVTDSP